MITAEKPLTLPAERRRRTLQHPSLFLAAEVLLAVVTVSVSILVRPWVDRLGDTRYQEFLRLEWLLVAGGKGLQLDLLSLPLPPLLHVGGAALVGERLAEVWIPIVVGVGIVLVLTRSLFRGYPVIAMLLAAVPLLASPFFYLLQRQLDLQLFVLLLGLQILTLRAFRQRPTVARVTAAIGLNVLLSLTSYAALVAMAAAVIYLLLLTNRQHEVQAAAWRALLWLYIPFSLSGYLLWAVFWVVAGSRIKTSYFMPDSLGGLTPLQHLVRNVGGELALPLLLLLGLAIALRIFLRHPENRSQAGLNQALAWAVLAFMGIALGLLSLRTFSQVLLVQPEAITFGLILLVPTAIMSLYGQVRDVLRTVDGAGRILLVLAGATVLAIFPLQYVLRPAMRGENLLPVASRVPAERQAGAKFAQADPGGKILIDPRFSASFALASRVDPHRLLTPFDRDFKRLVVAPPDDVQTIVVTDTLDDFVAGNYTAERLLDVLPDATLVADGKAGGEFTRAFRRYAHDEPTRDASRVDKDPVIAAQEDAILHAILNEMSKDGGLPLRPDGWAYAVDVGNLMVYAAERGDVQLFRSLSETVHRYYLVTGSDDANALYTIAWRARADRPPEASGTTETLRMVEAYWTAGQRWNNEYYRRLALAMARAYARHQTSDQYGEGWYIRNYYNYGTKEYATNTFLVDYAPDVLRRVADGMHDPDLRAVADKSAEFVAKAQLDFGFFYEMYQPEISTLYADITYFSPNGHSQIIDSHEAALGISDIYAPDRARRLYQFTKDQYLSQNGAIASQYQLDGTPYGVISADHYASVYAFVARLSVRIGDTDFARQLIDRHMGADRMYANASQTPDKDGNWFFSWSSALLALRAYQEAFP